MSSANVGRTWGPVTATVDARWAMAYSSGIPDRDPRYYATQDGPVPVHPLFPVSAEWSLLIDAIATSGAWSREDALRGVHATHDLVLHRPLQSGTSISVTAKVAGLEQRSPGAYQVVEHTAVDTETGEPLWTSWTGSLFRGVGTDGPNAPADVPPGPDPAPPAAFPTRTGLLEVDVLDAHRYTECARIWNPIHTDRAVALSAGLPDLILHGTATLAKTVSALIADAGAAPGDVRRIRVRFSRPALLPSTLTLQSWDGADGIRFTVLDADGAPVLRDGMLELRS